MKRTLNSRLRFSGARGSSRRPRRECASYACGYAGLGKAIIWLTMLFGAGYISGADQSSAMDGEQVPALHGVVKVSGLSSHAGEDELLFPARDTQTGLARARFVLTSPMGASLNGELAYEHRIRAATSSARWSSGGVLPSEGDPPFRIVPLDWRIAEREDGEYLHYHEVDRAVIAWKDDRTQATLGRQAIGLGRGVLFSAVDVFSPFSPTEVDREWRPGVDAVRVERMFADTFSTEVIGVFGEMWEESALLGRVRGYTGKLDAEFIGGKLGEDGLYAVTVSGAAGDAEVHTELAVFHTAEEKPETGLLGNCQLVTKAVVGSSYTFGIGQGLTLLGEYLYSEFGSDSIEELQSRVGDPIWPERVRKGELTVPSRHALGVRLTYPVGVAWTASLMGLCSATDGSGLAAPSVSWNATRNVTAVLSGQVPWGAPSSQGLLQSEYGATPASVFLQVTVYY